MLASLKNLKSFAERTKSLASQAIGMLLVSVLAIGLIAASPLSASAALPYEITRIGSDVTLTVDCNVPVDVYTKNNIDMYQGERLIMTSKAGTTCTNITVRSSDAPSTTLATGIFAAPWPTTFTNIMLQQVPYNGTYTATVLSNAPIGKTSKPIAITNAGTKGAMFQVTVKGFDPTIGSISPNTGATTGGQQITITGTNFAAGTTVTIGGVACTNIVIVSSTSITCNAPAGTAGAKNVVVRNSDGLSATSTGGFTYRLISSPSTKNTTDFYADLNGTDTWFKSVGSQGPIPAAGSFTLDFWVYDPGNRSNTLSTILAQSGSDATQKLEIQIDKTGLLNQELNIVYRGVDYRTLFKLPQDTWVHVTLLSNASYVGQNKIWLRIDGEQVFEAVTDIPVDAGKQIIGPLFVGRAFDDANKQLFKGRVDQVKVWNNVLGNESIFRSMHTWGSQGVQAGTALLAHYDFNDRTVAGGQVFNKAASTFSLVLTTPAGTTPFADVKQTISTSGKTTYLFPRSYLTEVGGWTLPNGVTAIPEALIVGGGGAGGSDGASGGGGGGSQFGSIPTLSANQVLTIQVGQGGVPGDFSVAAPPTNGQSSNVSIPTRVIASASGGATNTGALGSPNRAAGGTSASFANFTATSGGAGGLGVRGAGYSTPAESGLGGTTLAGKFDKSYSFSGGGGGGILNVDSGSIPTIVAAPGQNGGGEGASTGSIGVAEKYFCAGNTSGMGASTGGNGTANTGGGGGGGTAGGSPEGGGFCRAIPNTRYDGERTSGGHGGSGVVIFGVTSSVPVPGAPTYEVVATDNGTSAITASWPTMSNASTTRKIVQYRIAGGTWYQATDSSTATSHSLPRTFAGTIEFRVSQLDSASEQWGEWVYSNQLTIELYGGAALCENPLKLRYDIASQSVTMRFTNSLTPITVRWGDGTQVGPFSTTVSSPVAQQIKSYTSSGAYTIEVCGKFESFTTTGANLIEIVDWGEWHDNTGLTDPPARSLASAFVNATRLIQVPANFPSTVTNAASLFQGATLFNDSNVSNWNVSNVTNMSSMFNNAPAFNQTLSGWNVNSATNMSSMFANATVFNQDLSSWNVSNVTNMSSMFSGARAFNFSISSWNTSEVTNFSRMLFNASAYTHKPPLKLAKATDASNMLDYSGISDITYSAAILDWVTSSPTSSPFPFGAVDKTALCKIPGTVNNPHGALMSFITSGWVVTDKSSRLLGLCDTTIKIKANSINLDSSNRPLHIYGNPVPSAGFTPEVIGPRAVDPTWVDQVTCAAVLEENGDPVTSSTPPGEYVTQCNGPTSAGTGIKVEYVTGTHVVHKRPLSIKINNRVERKGSSWSEQTFYSDTDGQQDFAISSGVLVGEDNIAVTATKASRSNATEPEEYILEGSLDDSEGGVENERYDVTFTSGVLTISNKTYVVTAKNLTKVYGETLTLDNLNGWTCQAKSEAPSTDSECETDLRTKTVTLSSDGVGNTAPVGVYPIQSSVSDLTDADDYLVVDSNGGSITVTKRPLYVTPSDLIVNAGSEIPSYSFELANWALSSNDHPEMVGFTPPTCTSGYTPDTPRGTELTITCSGGYSDLYYFVYGSATLTVPALSSVTDLTPEQVSSRRGGAVVPFSFTVSPVLEVCYATLLVTNLADSTVTESRILVQSSDIEFDLQLPDGEYQYELVTDGNCVAEPNSRSLKIAPQSGSIGNFPTSTLPTPSKISPSKAKPNTRTDAVITGQNLNNVVKVQIGGKTVKVRSITGTSLKFRIPKLKPGRYDILLIMRDGSVQRWQNSLRITGKSSSGVKSQTFIGFAVNSYKMPSPMRQSIRRFLTDNKAKFSTVECVGYTDGPFVKRVDVPLSMNRAKVACNLAKSLGYKIESTSYVNLNSPGASKRKVKLILGK